MKKTYIAPSAQLTYFAPREDVAAGWQKGNIDSEGQWWLNDNLNFWGGVNATASAATGYWYNDLPDEFK